MFCILELNTIRKLEMLTVIGRAANVIVEVGLKKDMRNKASLAENYWCCVRQFGYDELKICR